MVSQWQIKYISLKIRYGSIIAYPTEAVWGLGCDPYNKNAVSKLLKLKKRSVSKGLILIASNIEQFSFLLNSLTVFQMEKLKKTWPGPNTWLVPHQNKLPYFIVGDHSKVALRVSNHPIVKQICDSVGPIVSTSANISGQPAATSALMVEKYFHGLIDGKLNGPVGNRKRPSTIRDIETNLVIRD